LIFPERCPPTPTIRHIPCAATAIPLIRVDDLNLWYDFGEVHALNDISMELYPGEVLAFIGPSGCGKSTMLKVFNRMHDMDRGVRRSRAGSRSTAADINAPEVDPPLLRRRFGWVAQKPNPFPDEHLAERVLRAAHPRADAGHRRDGGACGGLPAPRASVGRGEGQAP
jgi:ABC-type phosphate transport system ATPase subunit